MHEIDSIADLHTIVNFHNEVLLFGAGKIAKTIVSLLSESDNRNHIVGILVTNLDGNEKALGEGTPVFEVRNNHFCRDTIVLVAVNHGLRAECVEKVLSAGFENVVTLSTRFGVQLNRPFAYRLMIETTNICNARCKFCPNRQLKRPKRIMSDAIFDCIVERIQKEKIKLEKFILHLNGEPFTDKKLINRIMKLKSLFPAIPIRFTSNFSLPTQKEIDDLVDSGLDCLTISLNATNSEDYKTIMGGLDWNLTINNIAYLLRRIKATTSKMQVEISFIDGDETVLQHAMTDLLGEQLKVRSIKKGKWIGYENLTELPVYATNHKRICPDLNEQICILSNGDYAFCCFDCEGKIKLNVKNTPIMQAFYSDKFESLRLFQLENEIINPMCKQCSFLY